jgi:Wiskott-Aldrich syndrome protein
MSTDFCDRLAIPNTVASSPQPYEMDNPESEHIPILSEPPVYHELESAIDPENEPVPIWPLPTRVFPVQNLPKIPTGNAPAQSLEKKTPLLRPWRQAQREVRGIAGGRWFVRSWIGEKDSEYALWKASGNAPAIVQPTTKKLKFLKPDTGDRTAPSGASTPGVIPEISIVQQS